MLTKYCFFFFTLLFTFTTNAQTTKTYRQGVNGYNDCHSVDISDLNLQGNNNGTSFGDGNNDWCIGKLHGVPGMGYDISPLLRFDSLNIPPGSQVTTASLTITMVMWATPSCRVIGRYLNVQWYGNIIDPNGGVSNAPVGWQRRLPNTPWSVNGAIGEGTDLIAGKYFVLPPDSSIIPPNGQVTYTVPLDITVVQNWINNSATNNGLKMQCDRDSIHVYFVQPQRPEVMKRPMLSITYTMPNGISGNGTVPHRTYLEQNFPNPFNPVTDIDYHISEPSLVKLSVLNILGESIALLVNEQKSAGDFSVRFDASKLASGMYFYKMETENYSETKKFILIK